MGDLYSGLQSRKPGRLSIAAGSCLTYRCPADKTHRKADLYGLFLLFMPRFQFCVDTVPPLGGYEHRPRAQACPATFPTTQPLASVLAYFMRFCRGEHFLACMICAMRALNVPGRTAAPSRWDAFVPSAAETPMPIPSCEITRVSFESDGPRAPHLLPCNHVFSLAGLQVSTLTIKHVCLMAWWPQLDAKPCRLAENSGISKVADVKENEQANAVIALLFIFSNPLAMQRISNGGVRCPRCGRIVSDAALQALPLHSKLATLVRLLRRFHVDPQELQWHQGALAPFRDVTGAAVHTGVSPHRHAACTAPTAWPCIHGTGSPT